MEHNININAMRNNSVLMQPERLTNQTPLAVSIFFGQTYHQVHFVKWQVTLMLPYCVIHH
jgi:hypothetical protein